MRKWILVVLPLFLVLSPFVFVRAQQEHTEVYGNSEGFEKKIYSVVNIDSDFDSSSVLVVMDKKVGGINKVHDESFFGNFPKKTIKDLTAITVGIKDALIEDEEFRQILQIQIPENSKENVLNVIRQLEKIEGIVYAGHDYLWHFDQWGITPNDPNFKFQWSLPKIQVPEAWVFSGSNYVRVGIIDTGISYHPDLSANLVAGWDFVSGNSFTAYNDTVGHGTHVAGIVGAVINNGVGIAGINWNTRLVPLKTDFVSPTGPITFSSTILAAVNYAKNNNIPILNASLGDLTNDFALKTAIETYSGLFVCTAGNNNTNIDNFPHYPGSWGGNNSTYRNIITVGATNAYDARWLYSNYGSNAVDLFAPGEEIISTFVDGNGVFKYESLSGTSMAAPHVTGVAALLMSQSGLSAREIKKIILDNVDKVSSLNGYCVTGGRLNAFKAVYARWLAGWCTCQ